MRDIVLTALVLGSIPIVLRRPYVGVLIYIWLSVMNPHRLTWGFAYEFNFAAIIAIVTLIGVVFGKDRRPPPINGLTVSLALFVFWTCVSTVFALNPSAAYSGWETMMKTQLMTLLIPVLFHRKEQVRLLIWVIVLSLAYYGTKGGLFVILTGGADRVYGPQGSYIEDNNALAVALIMAIPLMRYLQLTSTNRYVRWGLTAMMLLCGLAVLGSYSRGALLAVIAMLAFLWLKGRHKLAFFLVGVVAFAVALSIMPEQWYRRMATIETYQQDSSANMRLNAWGTMLNIAKDRPLVGGGFEVDTKENYDKYSPDPSYPPQVAHSIYFQALGEHGFVGLGLFLILYILVWRYAATLVRKTRSRPDLAWAGQFAMMMQVSIIGFAVGGAFLSLVNFDVPYYLIAAVVVVSSIVDRQLLEEMDATPVRDPRSPPGTSPHSASLTQG